ncbi:TIGR04282 family arsenosugar biosynthesis glycosyltransferase [Christiangramia sp. SM2212]|uniref:TIGR04282 family arsenosugar biosynthesis glycosyltransferase n=1 Tax=Christiangramia sediminicola TaxID=3073267 RepID=A0ABU1ELD1_9FLAO|nr:TIGR04282 family arsenosugar biosynthesis glycosyltransferase [Christiangramia sp. SM2212]MDR5589195.1 TIGR04282 family arsenosugar biosynthesis glycosyltransferase [Christiangramia sp. SM2212]
MKNSLYIFLFILVAGQLNAQSSLDELLKKHNSGVIPYISVQELRMYQLDEEVIILDAREREEYDVSHLESSIFVGYNDFDDTALETVSKDQKIVVYCSLGIRSENIGKKLWKSGFTNVQNLYGGIFEWKNNDFPVLDSDGRETEKVHAFSGHWAKWLKKGEKIYQVQEENKDNLLLIFTKNPVAGKVKTRLAKDLGDDKALEIYKFLIDHTVKFTTSVNSSKQVYYSDAVNENDIWSNDIFSKRKQNGDDLGIRMENAFQTGFNEGFRKIIVIGSDMYDINTEDIKKAFQKLNDHEYVIGPALDGGYYLFGMKSLNSDVFKNKEWGTSSVLKDTLKELDSEDVAFLETRNDVDLLDDIKDHPAFQKFIK